MSQFMTWTQNPPISRRVADCTTPRQLQMQRVNMEDQCPWMLTNENGENVGPHFYLTTAAHNERVLYEAMQEELSYAISALLPSSRRATIEEKVTFNMDKKLLSLPNPDSNQYVSEVHGYQLRYVVMNPRFTQPEVNVVFISSWLSTGKIQNILVKLNSCEDAVSLVEAGRRLMYISQHEKMVKINNFTPRFLDKLRVSVETKDRNFQEKWCVLDEEVFMILKSSEDPSAQDVFWFYLEPGPDVIDEIKLNMQNVISLCAKPFGCSIDLTYANEDIRARFVTCLKTMGPKSKQIFTDAFMYEEYLNSKLVTKQGRGPVDKGSRSSTRDHPEIDNLNQQFQSHRITPQPEAFMFTDGVDTSNKTINVKHYPEQLQLMWAVAEAEFSDIIAKGLVPGSSILSGGLDQNSKPHFNQCMEEITEAIYSQQYDVAVSHLRGVRDVFRLSRLYVANDLLSIQDDIKLLKFIFFKNCQQ